MLFQLFHIISLTVFTFLVVRDLDGYIYFREYEGCIVAGGFEPVAKPAYENGKIPSKLNCFNVLNVCF